MNDDILKQKQLANFKKLVEYTQNIDIDIDKDLYCELMKNMILNTYSVN